MPVAYFAVHLGYVEERNYENIYGTAVEQILAFATGKPINLANT